MLCEIRDNIQAQGQTNCAARVHSILTAHRHRLRRTRDQSGLHTSLANLLVASSSACSLSMRDRASTVLCASRGVLASNSSRPGFLESKLSNHIHTPHFDAFDLLPVLCFFEAFLGLLNNFIRPQLFKNWIPWGQWRRQLVLRERGEAHDQHPPRDK